MKGGEVKIRGVQNKPKPNEKIKKVKKKEKVVQEEWKYGKMEQKRKEKKIVKTAQLNELLTQGFF